MFPGKSDAGTEEDSSAPRAERSPSSSRRQSMEKKRPRSGSPMTRNRSNSSLPTTQDEGRLMQAMEASSRRRGPARTYASRFRKLHGELKRVVERHEQGQPSGMWARRLWQACSLGAALQLTVVVLLCLEGGEGGRFLVSVGDALAVLAALVLLVVLQQAQLTRADTMIISRARRFLNRLMSFASDEEFASRETLAEHARARSVWDDAASARAVTMTSSTRRRSPSRSAVPIDRPIRSTYTWE